MAGAGSLMHIKAMVAATLSILTNCSAHFWSWNRRYCDPPNASHEAISSSETSAICLDKLDPTGSKSPSLEKPSIWRGVLLPVAPPLSGSQFQTKPNGEKERRSLCIMQLSSQLQLFLCQSQLTGSVASFL